MPGRIGTEKRPNLVLKPQEKFPKYSRTYNFVGFMSHFYRNFGYLGVSVAFAHVIRTLSLCYTCTNTVQITGRQIDRL